MCALSAFNPLDSDSTRLSILVIVHFAIYLFPIFAWSLPSPEFIEIIYFQTVVPECNRRANRVVGGTRIRIGIQNCTRFQQAKGMEEWKRARERQCWTEGNVIMWTIYLMKYWLALMLVRRFSVLPFDRCFRLHYISSSAAAAAAATFFSPITNGRSNMFQYLILFIQKRRLFILDILYNVHLLSKQSFTAVVVIILSSSTSSTPSSFSFSYRYHITHTQTLFYWPCYRFTELFPFTLEIWFTRIVSCLMIGSSPIRVHSENWNYNFIE